jgi:hypothetical protein
VEALVKLILLPTPVQIKETAGLAGPAASKSEHADVTSIDEYTQQ